LEPFFLFYILLKQNRSKGMNFLGIDIGSSSIKAALVNGDNLQPIGYSKSPGQEMDILAHRAGWAEQDPEIWWKNLVIVCQSLKSQFPAEYARVGSIGISYQMHGLVLTDSKLMPLRPAIIWCDSRAVSIGEKAFHELGNENCLRHFLNSPGNFTASKLRWIQENEPSVYFQARYAFLPGDFIAARLTGEVYTTFSGLSEGVLWDFINNKPAHSLFTYFDFKEELFPEAVGSFGYQGTVLNTVASELGLPEGAVLGYRAGDQPNNAFSLGVMEPGQVGANAGTSGVIYGINDKLSYDSYCRVNSFAHVNHSADQTRIGVLSCLNGTGNFYSWVRKLVAFGGGVLPNYSYLNEMAETIHPGSDHLKAYPFGNGAERLLMNQNPGGSFSGLNFNIHTPAHLVRASLEGIVFAMYYGMEIMGEMGMAPRSVRAAEANLFLSPLFRQMFADVTGAELQLVQTNGSLGAAIGGAIGIGKTDQADWLANLNPQCNVSPDSKRSQWYGDLYQNWKAGIALL
jgi:xylulokinase